MLRPFFRRQKTLLHAILETMEPRQLLSGAIDPRFISDAEPDIKGTAGDDHIIVQSGEQPGDLVIVSAPGFEPGEVVHNISNVVIDGGDGNDTIEFRGGDINVTLAGGPGEDVLIGRAKHVTLDGGPGNDTITALSGDREWSADIAFSGALHGVVVRLDLGQVLDDGFGTADQVSGIGDVQGTPWNDTIYTGNRSFTMYGKGGDDFMLTTDDSGRVQLAGGSGNDTLQAIGEHVRAHFYPGRGNDTVIGGGGRDAITIEGQESEGNQRFEMISGAVVRLDRGLIENDGYGGVDTISSIENITVYSGKFGNVMYGTDADETFIGDEGPDLIVAGGGNDRIVGGDGATVMGGEGNDEILSDWRFNFIDGGPGADTITLYGCKYDRDVVVKDEADRIIRDYPTGTEDCRGKPQEQQAARHKKKKHKHHKPARAKSPALMTRRE